MQIKEVKIYSSKIKDQIDFYTNILGLEIIYLSEEKVSFKVGESILHIEYREKTTPYHFAINIPANKTLEALEWLRSRVEILKDGVNEVQDFDFWNAEAIYFYDRDQNIVELIARKNLNNDSNEKFDVHQFLEISEIGAPTTDIEKQYHQLRSLTGVDVFDGGFERFCAIGDERGLLICINKNEKDWFPTNEKAFSSEFEIKLIEKGAEYQIAFVDQAFKEISN